MIVVTDTSPLNYLVLIRAVDVLPALFGAVIVPPAVVAELEHARTPEAVRQWVQAPPPWLDVRPPTQPALPLDLGAGEVEVITLALELRAERVLLDDRRARRAASDLGLTVVGTLAVLAEAGQRGLVDLDQALQRLAATTFRIHPSVLASLRNPGPSS
jgi:predicted nucleic acid-binding protein